MIMKEIRKLKEVSVYENSDDENNNEMSLSTFDNEPGFYQQVVRPMLAPGHEKQLVGWLKEIGILRQTQMCKNASTNACCNVPMTWTPARIVDNYQWKCLSCSQKKTIRDDSVFHNVKCKFKDAIRIFLGWCKGLDEETIAGFLGIRKQVVKTIYELAGKTSESYLRSYISQYKLGGPGIVVIIDTYPDVYSSIANQEYTPASRPILCIAEVKNVPTNFWLESLDRYNSSDATDMDYINDRALRIVQQVVAPGSVIVANLNTTVCAYRHLLALKHYYPLIVTTDGVARHDTPLQSLMGNLEVIWRPVIDICEEAQDYSMGKVQQFLFQHVWRRRFGNTSFQTLLNQLSH